MADPGERLYEAMDHPDCEMVWATAHPDDKAYWAEIEAKARRLAAEDIREAQGHLQAREWIQDAGGMRRAADLIDPGSD